MSEKVAASGIHAPVDPRVHRVELIISTVLRAGVLVSLLLVATGIALSLVQHHAWLSDPAAYTELMNNKRSIPDHITTVISGVAKGDGQAIVMLGLLALITTPVTRVAFSIAIFAYQKDRAFVWITTLVLALLGLSFFLGKAE